jgi:hypothetical protein
LLGNDRFHRDAVRFTDCLSDALQFVLATRHENEAIAAACEAIGVSRADARRCASDDRGSGYDVEMVFHYVQL